MDAADVAVLPRSVCSGFPIKILNYLAVGTPVVVAEGSDMNLEGCLSFPNGDFRMMARLIASLIEDEHRRKNSQKQEEIRFFVNILGSSLQKKLGKVYLSLLNGVEK